ncbi:MAG: helix-turn-helix domain-containing protein [Spirochaetia bacterium]|jgi:transcriptional regulator with XRE-family HTH domain|nr:helix-turn-helix domain-containing protein [Spirochaetia bacterium]
MNKPKETDPRFESRYKNHPILSLDILDKKREADFFTQIRLRIKEARKDLRITQREFGETAGIDRRYVAKVECGSQNPSFKFLRSISIKHKLSLDWVLYGVGQKNVLAEDVSYGEELYLFKKLLDKASPEDIEVVMKMIKKIL